MKWFFAVNEATLAHHDHDFPGLILAAVASARAHTTLEPHLLYDGAPNELTAQLLAMGVKIIPHRISFHAEMSRSTVPDFSLAVASGAYLRTEIPTLELDDEFVLYTDCDVIFLKQPSFLDLNPPYFASAPQTFQDDINDLNTGVMLMNVNQLRSDWTDFRNYIIKNFEGFIAYDQGAYKTYYEGRFNLLPSVANWKPYWGRNDAAEIIHFHGPKPMAIRKTLNDPAYPISPGWRHLFDRDLESYGYYLAVWDHYRNHADVLIAQGRT
jgi:hypothetical protein